MVTRLMRFLSLLMVGVAVISSVLFLGNPDLHAEALEADLISEETGQSVLALMRDDSQIISASVQDTMQGQLRIELPANVDADRVEVINDYMDETIEIVIEGIDQSYFYDYPMIGTAEHISDIYYDCISGTGTIDIMLDSVYEPEIVMDGNYMYISFLDPHEVYDYIVVVDAGHGGKDVGASQGDVLEKDINLAIVQKIQTLFEENAAGLNIGVYYTRTEDVKVSLDDRVGLANALDADLFLSVHINSTSSGRTSQINGTEVMYLVADDTGASKQFASICLEHLLDTLGSNSKGLVAGDTIKIIRTSEVPVALAEIGFMTNETERTLLTTDDYQQKAAQALYDAVVEALQDTTVNPQ